MKVEEARLKKESKRTQKMKERDISSPRGKNNGERN